MSDLEVRTQEQIKAPSIFIGHGSPMNALELNAYTKTWRLQGKVYKPKAICVISAHWLSEQTEVSLGDPPKTIHDFYGFPKELYAIKYPAPAVPASYIDILFKAGLKITNTWGLDHGAWSVLKHMFPSADVPVFQMSINKNLSLKEHFEVAKTLSFLKSLGVMILCSGNIVHNLSFMKAEENYSWAEDLEKKVVETMESEPEQILDLMQREEFLIKLAHPTLEHIIPLIYFVGSSAGEGPAITLCKGVEMGAISMASFLRP